MEFLPISIRVSDQQILFIGGGKVALHKLKILKQFTSHFKVIAPEIQPAIKKLDGVEWHEREYQKGDLKGFRIAYITTNNHELNHRIARHAKEAGCLVNVADKPAYCDFVSPAILIDQKMSIAVGSDSKNVLASIKLRDKIKLMLAND